MFSLSSLRPIEQLVDSDNLPDVAIFHSFVKKCEKRFFSSAAGLLFASLITLRDTLFTIKNERI